MPRREILTGFSEPRREILNNELNLGEAHSKFFCGGKKSQNINSGTYYRKLLYLFKEFWQNKIS